MASTYKKFYEIEPDLFSNIILGKSETTTEKEPAGLMAPTTSLRPQARPANLDTELADSEAIENTLLGVLADQIGKNSGDREAVAKAVAQKPKAQEEIDLSEWESMPSVDATLAGDTTREALGSVPTMDNSGDGGDFITSALDEVLANEGGFQMDEADTGNYRPDGTLVGTNKGITPNALAEYRGVDANSITAKDIQDITEEEARAIYRQNYYERPGLDQLPQDIRENVFDMYVNAGSNAIKILQRIVGVEEDGRLGPETLAAIEDAKISNEDYSNARISYYRNVAQSNPDKQRFLEGWINRANKYRN